ncbi:hypothetical protein ACFWYW_23750 [Nonomuraea sp. NPDC059023]|uniref:hypothetical protein n=1 Tax=unclassified Nonomuraea TaxID=2593643 RepID=UPI00367D4C83
MTGERGLASLIRDFPRWKITESCVPGSYIALRGDFVPGRDNVHCGTLQQLRQALEAEEGGGQLLYLPQRKVS